MTNNLVCTCIPYTRGCSLKNSCAKEEGEGVSKVRLLLKTGRERWGWGDGKYDFE